MNIGIIKFGLVIRDFGFHNQGGDVEVINFIDIMSKDNEVYIISAMDKKARFKKYNGEKLDIIFAFNGPWTTDNSKLTMFKNYTLPYLLFLNEHDVPWVYIQSDNRKTYDIRTPKELNRAPSFWIGMQNEIAKVYFDFDKFSIPGVKMNYYTEKTIPFGILANDTDTSRSKKILNFCTVIDGVYKIPCEIKGKWKKKNKWNNGMIKEKEVSDYLSKVKYTVNIAVNPEATSQKIWEYIMNDVVCFYYDYDEQCNIIPKDCFLRVKDEYDLGKKIELLEKDNLRYNQVLKWQHNLLKQEYVTGEYVREKYNKLCHLISKK